MTHTDYSSFLANLRKRGPLSDQDALHLIKYVQVRHLKKKEHLLRAGEVCQFEAYIVKGCMRVYLTDSKGHEHVVQIGFEDWWIADMSSFFTGQPAHYSIEAIEECEILLIDRTDAERLFEEIPSLERSFRILVQNAYVSLQQRMIATMSQSAEERYLNLIKKFPQLELRVAQHHIASYLGISPEALSRIRKSLIEKQRAH